MRFNEEQFKQELRQLIEKYLGTSPAIEDYLFVAGELEKEVQRLDLEAEQRFPDEDGEGADI
jgi:hypothetical protein